jgi:hypothetical protein
VHSRHNDSAVISCLNNARIFIIYFFSNLTSVLPLTIAKSLCISIADELVHPVTGLGAQPAIFHLTDQSQEMHWYHC